MTTRIPTTTIVATALVAFAFTSAQADVYFQESKDQHARDTTVVTQVSESADDRLLIVNGKTGRVIYDDGKDDLFCVTRKVIVGYDEDGDPIRKRVMRCR